MRKPFIAGNWKMYKLSSEARALAHGLRASLSEVQDREIVVCPPATALPAVIEELKGSSIGVGGQNAHWETQGAFTGELSPAMLKDVGCGYAIVGHSERRQYFGETDATVNKRMLAVLKAGLVPIVCIGETLQEREANATMTVIEKQMLGSLQSLTPSSSIVIAYEPVWAIGTGKTATPEQAQDVHAFIRKQLAKIYGDPMARDLRIVYGGSVKPDNMSQLMSQPDIDGGLVGGASLEVDSFTKIVRYSALTPASK
jgi:triosephosphate isomerase